MSDPLVPFHVWAMHERDRIGHWPHIIEKVKETYPIDIELHNDKMQEAFADICASYATLLNVLGSEAQSRFEADVKGHAITPAHARPPEYPDFPDAVPMREFVFQSDSTGHRTIIVGRNPTDAFDRINVNGSYKLVGWL